MFTFAIPNWTPLTSGDTVLIEPSLHKAHCKNNSTWMSRSLCLTVRGTLRVLNNLFLDVLSGGRNSLLVVFGLTVHSVAGLILLWGKFAGRGDFSLGVNRGSNSIPPKTLSDESINQGLVCAHMHFIARTQKILTFMS